MLDALLASEQLPDEFQNRQQVRNDALYFSLKVTSASLWSCLLLLLTGSKVEPPVFPSPYQSENKPFGTLADLCSSHHENTAEKLLTIAH